MELNMYLIMAAIATIGLIIVYVLYYMAKKSNEQLKEDLNSANSKYQQYKLHTKHLMQYEVIDDAKLEAKRIITSAETALNSANIVYQEKIEEAEEAATSELKDARAKAKEIRDKAEQKLTEAHKMASNIEKEAKAKANEVAGEAWEAKKNADQYEATAKAMKNIIKGYGDEYLIPNTSVLDELAEEYDYKEAGQNLKNIRTRIKSMIKNQEAAECDYVEEHRRNTAIEFVLDAFNGKVDTIMSKVKHDNYGKLLQQLEDAYRVVNHNGQPFRNARITSHYYDAVVLQLKRAVTVQEIRQKDLEEQRRIKEEIREEERAQREYQRAIKKVEKEEKLLQKAMKEAEERLSHAAAADKLMYEQQLEDLRQKLVEAEEKSQRALSMAQQTKQGHVYVISNVGSFGEDIFKIGLTRRLEPLDRVRELGDASVPFSFDVHAMIHSDDAPALEKELHTVFNESQVNKVNPRKEFFRVPLTQIKEKVSKKGLETLWTMKAEALEYRESLQMVNKVAQLEGNEATESFA
jgi:DNA repair exonuclease SbcCD ATPase subunit